MACNRLRRAGRGWRVGIRQRAFEFHPQQCGGGIEAAGEGDADFLADGEICKWYGFGSWEFLQT